MDKLITIAAFDFPADAETRRVVLEQEGIRTFLADGNLVGTDWFYANAVGGAKIQVAESDVERARQVLAEYAAPEHEASEESLPEDVSFACQECGKSITFPGDRCGHVETCPECGSYVDVPNHPDGSQVKEPATTVSGGEQSRTVQSGSRTASQLWLEVLAVLCLSYIPYLFGAITSFNSYHPSYSSHLMFYRIISAFQVSMPLLVIVALAGDRWSLLGIVHPEWITDVVIAIVICVVASVSYNFVMSFLPSSLLRASAPWHVLHRPEGILAYLLLLIECLASAFAQELTFRGYLIVRLGRLLRSTTLAVLVTTAMYASYHLYQGVTAAVGHAAIGLVYALSFCLFRRLWPLCLAHAIHNFAIYL